VYQITTYPDPDKDWSCTVTLRITHKYDEDRFFDPNSLFGWFEIRNPPTPVVFFKTSNKDELEDVLRRAQQAVLTGWSGDQANFRPDGRQKEAPFSPNVIDIQISDPDPARPAFSFYDLPGALNMPDDPDEQYQVELVERLIKVYLCDEKTFILLACSLGGDPETSSSGRYIRYVPTEYNDVSPTITN
jgi:hypothetical protein